MKADFKSSKILHIYNTMPEEFMLKRVFLLILRLLL